MGKAQDDQAQAQEDARRAALSQEDRDLEDLQRMEDEEAQRNAGRNGQGVDYDRSREAVTARLAEAAKARRAKQATETGVVARGRTVFTEAGQIEGHGPGSTIALTPEEKAKLTLSGHILTEDGAQLEAEAGPRAFSDTSLIQGHAKGQGAGAKPAGSKTK